MLDDEMTEGRSLAELEAFLVRVPERRLYGYADHLRVRSPSHSLNSAVDPKDSDDTFIGEYLSSLSHCDCHAIPLRSAQERRRGSTGSGLWACRDYLLSRHHLNTCGRQTCLLVHMIVYRAKNHQFGRTGPSTERIDPRKHSDITTEVMLTLQDMWGEEGGGDTW